MYQIRLISALVLSLLGGVACSNSAPAETAPSSLGDTVGSVTVAGILSVVRDSGSGILVRQSADIDGRFKVQSDGIMLFGPGNTIPQMAVGRTDASTYGIGNVLEVSSSSGIVNKTVGIAINDQTPRTGIDFGISSINSELRFQNFTSGSTIAVMGSHDANENAGYLALTNTSGVRVYCYLNGTNDGLTCSTTKP